MLPNNHPDREELSKLQDTLKKQIGHLERCLKHIDIMLNQDLLLKDVHSLDQKDRVVEKCKFLTGSINDYTRYKEIECNHPSCSHTPERTYRRDLAYSIFHRSFDKKCYTIDLDFLEYRRVDGDIKPVVLYDVKAGMNFSAIEKYYRDYIPKMRVYKHVANELEVPFWVVVYGDKMNKPLKVYEITDVDNMDYTERAYTPTEYRMLIESL